MAPGNLDIPGSSNTFAVVVGSGIDLEFSHRFELRMIQTEYYYTRFANEVNDHQNNLRVARRSDRCSSRKRERETRHESREASQRVREFIETLSENWRSAAIEMEFDWNLE